MAGSPIFETEYWNKRLKSNPYTAPKILLKIRKNTAPGTPKILTAIAIAPKELKTACQP